MQSALMYLVPEADIPAEPAGHAHVPLASGPRTGVAAAQEAVADAGLDKSALRRLPVVLGVELDNARMHEQRRVAARDGAACARDSRWTPMTVTSSAIAESLGTEAGHLSVGNACAASAYAITVAMDMIRSGEADVVLAGGAEGPTRVGMGAFNRLGAADPVRCRPFDRRRQGTVFGDGAAMLVLESAQRAANRGATGYAEFLGAAWSCDAHHPTAPDPDATQVIRGMRHALAQAGLAATDIGAVVPHGTGTPSNDQVESRALREVFGDHCARLPLLNLKGAIGHTAGVAGAFGCLAAALMIRLGRVPASATPDEQDPDCDVWIPRTSVALTWPTVLVNAYAFGGNNASLVLTAAEGDT
jgi:3-oxoacyl-[acyl-carrier-protein] synthase II